MTTTCATASCDQTAFAVVDGWPMCLEHCASERPDRTRSWEAYTLLRAWIARLHHVGLTDSQIAAATGISSNTARAHRRGLHLPTNRTEQQQTRADRLAREGDARISACACGTWRWDSTCSHCDQQEAASA